MKKRKKLIYGIDFDSSSDFFESDLKSAPIVEFGNENDSTKRTEKLHFLHIPKTGGSYIKAQHPEIGYLDHAEFRGFDSCGNRKYFKQFKEEQDQKEIVVPSTDKVFCVVRNPYSMLYSLYQHNSIKPDGGRWSGWDDMCEIMKITSFDSFCWSFLFGPWMPRYQKFQQFLYYQAFFGEECGIDYILFQERLDEGLSTILPDHKPQNAINVGSYLDKYSENYHSCHLPYFKNKFVLEVDFGLYEFGNSDNVPCFLEYSGEGKAFYSHN